MPNPPKPMELKRKLGNPGHGKLATIATLPGVAPREIPTPPEELEKRGLKLWNEAWEYAAPWLSTTLDAVQLEQACRLVDEIEEWRPVVRRAPILREPITTPTGTIVGEKWVVNPLEGVLRRGEATLRGILSDLGFNPTARAKLGVAQVKAASRLEELLENRRSRMASEVVDTAAMG